MNRYKTDGVTTNETVDSMLRRFKKLIMNEDILYEFRKRQYFMSKSSKRKEKSKRARIRDLKAKKNKPQ